MGRCASTSSAQARSAWERRCSRASTVQSVTLVDTRAARLERARDRLGFIDTRVAGPELADALRDATDGDMSDTVFDATGSLPAMSASLAYVGHGGTLVLVGVAPGDLVLADPQFHKRRDHADGKPQCAGGGLLPRDRGDPRRRRPNRRALRAHSLVADDLPQRLPQLIENADDVLKAIVSFFRTCAGWEEAS
ncbi:zinc-binding dehydrogenase [Sphingomonas sp. MMS24-JH45]